MRPALGRSLYEGLDLGADEPCECFDVGAGGWLQIDGVGARVHPSLGGGGDLVGGGPGKGGAASLYVDGQKVGEGTVAATAAMVFSADDGCDVGRDTGAPIAEDYGPRGNAFTGKVRGVQITVADAAEDADHLVSPEDAIRVAMARQ